MILSITFSKPAKDCEVILGKPYIRVRIRRTADSLLKKIDSYEAEFFTQKQVFQKSMSLKEAEEFLSQHGGTTFKNVVERTEKEEITIMSNRHGEIKSIKKQISNANTPESFTSTSKKTKNYLLKEGVPVPFLIKLGVMNKEGKVISQKYDKFRQINRFLEYINDIIADIQRICTGTLGFTEERPLRIADFGCGKSYLTFAVYHFLHDLKNIPVEIIGLDLKAEVIAECQKLANEFNYTGLHFYVGDIAEYNYKTAPDMIITLHACDTATDYAINYAVSKNATAILSVPCCQHEVNLELDNNKEFITNESPFATLTRYGIIKERLAALVTDAIRAETLEQNGYSVQILEFIDMSHTPKNLLIRAVKKESENKKAVEHSKERSTALLASLNVQQKLCELLSK